MRIAFVFLFCVAATFVVDAQCPDFQLAELQSLQKSADGEKENWLRSRGFDLASKTGSTLRYNKCWHGYHQQKAIYQQVVLWNTSSGAVTFLSPNQEAFQALRAQIEGRHGQTSTLGSSDYHVGQVFKYKFGSQYLDGVMHWSVVIEFK